jgi:DNA polymerase III gamma/tau subunit
LSFSKDKKISAEEVEQVAGAPRGELVDDFIKSIENKDLPKGLEAIKSAVSNNIDMIVYLKLILRKMRAILLLKYAKNMESSIKEEYSEEDFIFLKELSAKKESNINSKTLLELLSAYDSVARANIPELPLELALIKISS